MKEPKSSSKPLESSRGSSNETSHADATPRTHERERTSSGSDAEADSEPSESAKNTSSSADANTLESVLLSEEAGRLGWDQLLASINYLSSLIDIRGAHIAIGDRTEYELFRGFVHTLRAAFQAYTLPNEDGQALYAQAEQFLANGPLEQVLVAPATAVGAHEERPALLSGFVVTGRSGYGRSGRLNSGRALKSHMKPYLASLSQNASDEDRQTAARGVAGELFGLFALGFCLEERRAQGFQLQQAHLHMLLEATVRGLQSAALGDIGHPLRRDRVDAVMDDLIRRAFRALGLKIPKDLLRERGA